MMAYTGQISRQQRALSSSAAMLVVVAVGIGLANGLDLHIVRTIGDSIAAIAITAPKPPPAVPAPDAADDKATGAASPVNRHAEASAIVAPRPKLPLPEPPPIAVATERGTGRDMSAGAAPDAGPGSGAGGNGSGTGSGASGAGAGSGGNKAVWRSGRIKDSDYPKSASRAKIGGIVEVRFVIEPSGRATRCRTMRSSGDPALDASTCRLIVARFRFKPATNAAGEPIASDYGWRQSWWLEPRR